MRIVAPMILIGERPTGIESPYILIAGVGTLAAAGGTCGAAYDGAGPTAAPLASTIVWHETHGIGPEGWTQVGFWQAGHGSWVAGLDMQR